MANESVRLRDGIPLLGASAGAGTLLMQLTAFRTPLYWIATGILAAVAVGCAIRTIAPGAISSFVRAIASRWLKLLGDDDTTTTLRVSRSDDGPHAGRVVGRYYLGHSIGRGGMGHVYRATELQSGRVLAVKVVNKPEHVLGQGRFAREVQSLREVSSPHVVEVLDWGVTDDGHDFLAMELLAGRSLAAILEKDGRMALPEAVRLVEEIASGLTAAHQLGIVHRDIKPSNLFLSQQVCGTRWKILDFGLCKNYELHNSLTRGFAIGTPGFMSPEQAFGERLDLRSDVFALAVVTYCVLTGEQPFVGNDAVAIVSRVIHQQPCSPSGFRELPRDVELVLALGMAKRVSDRFPDAESFARALAAGVQSALDEELRQRGESLLRSFPWMDSEEVDTAVEPWLRRQLQNPSGPTTILGESVANAFD
ncbi:MAG TPA: serine/threonine-protein kinase [Polyangiaceae bacterium]|jgi:serine/threonine-protein kinase|nr:serine/threonine-protein kinase [Polyangiaceae bacterium]